MTQTADPYSHIRFHGTIAAAPNRSPKPRPRIRLAASALQSHQPARPPVISPSDRLLLEEIFRQLQLNIAAYRPIALGRRVPACLRALQARTPSEALRRLEKNPAALDLALNALLIGATTFFRDAPVFAHLRETALPALLHDRPSPQILSVGCSDGAELYSLAICLLELGCSDFSLRGIDCRPRAIESAKLGCFPASSLIHLSKEIRDQYFDPLPRGYQVKSDLRARLQWLVADAFIHSFSVKYDLIACRNFAIYLEHPAAARLWRRLHSALKPGGLLLTGNAEHPTSGFLRYGPCLFRKATP